MSDIVSVGAAFSDALNHPGYFNGHKVIAREPARYKHPRHDIEVMSTSSIVDKVLLDDGSEVWQCRVCGDSTRETVLSAIAHAGAHNRKPRTPKSQTQQETTSKSPVESLSDALDDAADVLGAPTRQGANGRSIRQSSVKPLPADLRGIVRNLTAIKIQLTHLEDAVVATAAELTSYAESLGPEVTNKELAELREKAAKFDQMRGLFT